VCSVDWSALGDWVQAWILWLQAGIFFTQAVILGVAASVALCQYRGFQENARIERTLRKLSDYNGVRRLGISGIEMTVASAAPLVGQAATDLTAFQAARDSGAKVYPLEILKTTDAAIVVLNYYNDAARQVKRNLIDEELFFEAQGYAMTIVTEPAEKIIVAAGQKHNYTELHAFVSKARVYLESIRRQGSAQS
jgi:hypothetical protein